MSAGAWRARAFGELRESLHGEADAAAWRRVLALLGLIEREGDADWVAQEIAPYAEQQLARWSDSVRQVRWTIDEAPGLLALRMGRWLIWEMDPRGGRSERGALERLWGSEVFASYTGIQWARVPPIDALRGRGHPTRGYPWASLAVPPHLVHLGLECATPGSPWGLEAQAAAPDVESWLAWMPRAPQSLWLGSFYMRQSDAHLEGGLRALVSRAPALEGVRALRVHVGVGPRPLDAALELLETPMMSGVERLSLVGTRVAEAAALCRALWVRSWPQLASVRLDGVSRRDAQAWREVLPRVELVTSGGDASWGSLT